MQLTDHNLGRLPRRRAGPGSDAGTRGEGGFGEGEITIFRHLTNTIRHRSHTR